MDRDCWSFIDGSEPAIETAKERREYMQRKNCAYTTICLCIEENLRTLIEGTKEGKEAWKILRDNFEPSTRAKLAALTDEFFSIKYKPGEGRMGEYISQINSVAHGGGFQTS